MTTDVDVLVVGGGIAGRAAAYFAARAGRRPTIVDDGVDRTSDLPVALVNPLRGHAGRLVPRGVDGMRATFALVDALRADGHPVAAGRGLYRPLVDRAEGASREGWWRDRLGPRLAFDWHPSAPAALGLVDPVPTLFMHDAGWVEPAGLLAALAEATGADSIAGRATSVTHGRANLADGTTLRANAVLWCAGASGAAGLDDVAAADGVYKPGSLAHARAALTSAPLSFGLYAMPVGGGTWIGPTREGAHATYPKGAVPPDAIRHLADRVAKTFGASIALDAGWRGVRLGRLSTAASRALAGVPALTALGSRGFLMAPLLAAEWARSL